MPTEVSLAQLPNRFEINGRVLKTEGKALRSGDAVVGILYTVSDISQLEKVQAEAATNRVLIGILRQKDAFKDFISECHDLIENSFQLVRLNDQITLRRVVHTLKGNAASSELREVAHAIHEMEESDAITAEHMSKIKELFISFLDQHKEIIAVSYGTGAGETYEVNHKHMANLHDLVAELKEREALPIRKWTAHVLQKPAASLLGPLEEFVSRLAQRLDKQVEFRVKGHDTLIDVAVMRGPFQNLIHLLRNAIDHGIETPDSRGNKSSVGVLELNIYRNDHHFCIDVSDDGKGIDTKRLAEKVVAKGFMTAEEIARLNERQKLDLVFLDSISSAESITEISGRGVGMSAMLEAVRKVQGKIEIDSEMNKGTKFRIEVPIAEFLKLGVAQVA